MPVARPKFKGRMVPSSHPSRQNYSYKLTFSLLLEEMATAVLLLVNDLEIPGSGEATTEVDASVSIGMLFINH
jgi:hypothetical protein